MEDASAIVAATNDREDQQVARAALNEFQKQRIDQEFNPDSGFRNAKLGQAVGKKFIDDNAKRLSDSAALLRKGLANDNQRKYFDQYSQVPTLQFRQALLAHQADQTAQFNDKTDDSSIDLQLRSMAQRPTDELNFQTGLAQINGVLDAAAKRKGLPETTLADLKAKYLDAAYTTRIASIMDGIPGVAPPNPYAAEKMFRQVQGQLGAQSQVVLAEKVQKAIQNVQARDTANSLVYGGHVVQPTDVAPAMTGQPLAAVIKQLERSGPNDVSPKGAVGEMQVMPATWKAPGFGIRPAQVDKDGKPMPGETDRVGRDFAGAMVARYGDGVLATAAYNAGPAKVDEWIQKYGDPRLGKISDEEWAAKIPFAETRDYVQRGIKLMKPGQNVPAPTAAQLKADGPARVEAARELARQQYPGDTGYEDAVASRTANLIQLRVANQVAQEANARDTLVSGLIGSKPDGSDRPLTIDQLLASPQNKQAWDAATPETKKSIQDHFRNGAGDPPRTPESQQLFYQYLGKFSNDREGFASEDLSPLIGKLPYADFDKLATYQVQARNKQELAAEKDINYQHALSLATTFALKPIKMFIPDKKTGPEQRKEFDAYTGRLSEALENYRKANGKNPSDKEIIAIAKGLTAQVSVPGRWWGSNDSRAFSLTPEDEAQATVKMTPAQKQAIASKLQQRYGYVPSESMVQQAALLEALHPHDMERLGKFDQTMKAAKR